MILHIFFISQIFQDNYLGFKLEVRKEYFIFVLFWNEKASSLNTYIMHPKANVTYGQLIDVHYIGENKGV